MCVVAMACYQIQIKQVQEFRVSKLHQLFNYQQKEVLKLFPNRYLQCEDCKKSQVKKTKALANSPFYDNFTLT